MSSFYCETCGATISDTSDGYITGCEHHPLLTRAQRLRIRAEKYKEFTGTSDEEYMAQQFLIDAIIHGRK